MSTWCILISGGSGVRMGIQANKTLISLLGEPALCRAFKVLRRHVDGIVLVVRKQDEAEIRLAFQTAGLPIDVITYGGADRQESVQNGLSALPEDCDIVLVHDGARPLIDDRTVENVLDSVRMYGSGIASTPVTDTIKQVDDNGVVVNTPQRDALRAVQTPQGFTRELLCRAHAEAKKRCTDDAALVESLGIPVHLCAGSPRNIKLTVPEDIALAEYYLGGMTRIGHGYDAHRLVEGRRLILGGVDIPHEKGLLGHSDADVLLHAIADALLGAAALGDIGRHFPDKDPQYKGISSLILLKRTAEILMSNGYVPANIDATVIAQRPKLAPYIDQMRSNIASVLNLPVSSVSVKATTTEHMGFEGEEAGISAHAVAIIRQVSI